MKNWYNSLSNPTRAALATVVFSFISTVLFSLSGFLNQVYEWSSNGGVAPDIDTLGKVIVSAAVAAAGGLVNFGIRYVQERRNPLSVPQYLPVPARDQEPGEPAIVVLDPPNPPVVVEPPA